MGQVVSPEQAFAWYVKAAAKKHPSALSECGISYLDGRGAAAVGDGGLGVEYLKEAIACAEGGHCAHSTAPNLSQTQSLI